VAVLNAGIWSFNRFVSNAPFARVGPSTWWHNLTHGFAFDPDTFGMNFFSHPYAGSLYFSTARSSGLGFWTSAPYALGGSLMWELLGENQLPSINDLITTSSGGVFLGEFLYRMSSQVLDDSATGWSRFWRETAAFIIDPVREFNRLVSGDAWRTSTAPGQIREPMHGTLSLKLNLISESANLSSLSPSPGAQLDLIYGESHSDIDARGPFDLLVLNAGLRVDKHLPYLNFNSYALWVGREYRGGSGQRHLLGLFQNFDFMKNELIHLGGTSFTGGLMSLFPLGQGFELNTSVQLGILLFGASNNRYTLIEQRDYNYGMGAVAKVEAWVTHPRFGRLSLHFDHFQIYTFEQAALEADQSHDLFSRFFAYYSLDLWKGAGIRLEYGLFSRHLHFEGQSAYNTYMSQVAAGLVFSF
jgi:hypothetical protein